MSNIITVIKLKLMGWTWHIERMGELRNAYEILVGRSKGERPLRRMGVHERRTLKKISKKQDMRVWTGFI
jgi:hypothetical protein